MSWSLIFLIPAEKLKRIYLQTGVLLLQDNAPAHTAQVADAAKCDFEKLPHASYSPDLHHLTSHLETKVMVLFDEGIAKLEHRWTKFTEVKRLY
uniref:Tc1-like transposase DDE domain-containing protein n=1 Tax=Amphiprion ocellaris TaxID=80972 RepID=A0AAQ5ZG42_AMPOC